MFGNRNRDRAAAPDSERGAQAESSGNTPARGEGLNLRKDREAVLKALKAMGDYVPPGASDDAFSFEAACRYIDGDKKALGYVIYGKSGFHRYLVEEDGSVRFSRMHAVNTGAVERARQAGFEIA